MFLPYSYTRKGSKRGTEESRVETGNEREKWIPQEGLTEKWLLSYIRTPLLPQLHIGKFKISTNMFTSARTERFMITSTRPSPAAILGVHPAIISGQVTNHVVDFGATIAAPVDDPAAICISVYRDEG